MGGVGETVEMGEPPEGNEEAVGVTVEVIGRGCDLVVGYPSVKSLFRSSGSRGCATAAAGIWCDGWAAELVSFRVMQ
jgi:hypothetical protein